MHRVMILLHGLLVDFLRESSTSLLSWMLIGWDALGFASKYKQREILANEWPGKKWPHGITFGLEYLIRWKWHQAFTIHQMSVLFGSENIDTFGIKLLYQNVAVEYLGRYYKYES